MQLPNLHLKISPKHTKHFSFYFTVDKIPSNRNLKYERKFIRIDYWSGIITWHWEKTMVAVHLQWQLTWLMRFRVAVINLIEKHATP